MNQGVTWSCCESCPGMRLQRNAFKGWGIRSWMPEAEEGICAGLVGLMLPASRRQQLKGPRGDITDKHRGSPREAESALERGHFQKIPSQMTLNQLPKTTLSPPTKTLKKAKCNEQVVRRKQGNGDEVFIPHSPRQADLTQEFPTGGQKKINFECSSKVFTIALD